MIFTPRAVYLRIYSPLALDAGFTHLMRASRVAHRVTVKGAASLQLVSGVALLRPDDVVFAAMLAGWRDQQAARNPSLSTIAVRLRVIRAFVDHVNSYPWQWLAQDLYCG